MDDLNIEKISNRIVNGFHDMIKVILIDDKVALKSDVRTYEKFNGCAYHVCGFINHDFWKECIEYRKQDNGLIKQSIKENKKKEATQYVIKAINEIIEFDKERSN